MKKYMYSQFDRVAKFYNVIQVSDLDAETFAKNLERSIHLCKDPSKLTQISDCELCFVGSYDDETMKFEILKEPQVILDCSAHVEAQLKFYEPKN